KGVAGNARFKFPTHGFFDRIDPLVRKFLDLPTLVANIVVMVLIGQGLLIQCHFVLELVLYRQAALYEEIQSIVDGGSAYAIPFVSHSEKKTFHIYMFILG